jgi:hypothetical protein
MAIKSGLTSSWLLARRSNGARATAFANRRRSGSSSQVALRRLIDLVRRNAGLVVEYAFDAFQVVRTAIAAVLFRRERAAIAVVIL